tara:strand:- start:92 stop:322 length:231 start_codon:yes stop_codon:yes gene_type:complete
MTSIRVKPFLVKVRLRDWRWEDATFKNLGKPTDPRKADRDVVDFQVTCGKMKEQVLPISTRRERNLKETLFLTVSS